MIDNPVLKSDKVLRYLLFMIKMRLKATPPQLVWLEREARRPDPEMQNRWRSIKHQKNNNQRNAAKFYNVSFSVLSLQAMNEHF